MSEASKIEWTKSTFNPWIGCTKVSPGCDHCYAERTDARGIYGGQKHWGAGVPRYRTSESNWNQVRRWNRQAAKTGEFWPVFSASQADIFDNEVPDEWRADFWALVRDCPHLTFQVLTKRIGNVNRMLPADWGDGYPNVWLISTIVNQEEADRDIPKLLSVPAVIHGLSMEPLLGPVNLRCIGWARSERGFLDATDGTTTYDAAPSSDRWSPNLPVLDWVIVGGESGNKARPMSIQWARSLRDQCTSAGVAFMFKQWGEYSVHTVGEDGDIDPPMSMNLRGILRWYSEPARWESPLPNEAASDVFAPGAVLALPVGKKKSGRLLDGREWNELPKVTA